jgi:hypothetical protein
MTDNDAPLIGEGMLPPKEKLADWSDSGLSNYYGSVALARRPRGQWVLTLGNHDGTYAVPVSPDFAAAWNAQFPQETKG